MDGHGTSLVPCILTRSKRNWQMYIQIVLYIKINENAEAQSNTSSRKYEKTFEASENILIKQWKRKKLQKRKQGGKEISIDKKTQGLGGLLDTHFFFRIVLQ
jgi:hypothetical protein